MQKTSEQYDKATNHCRSLFLKKAKDYGTAWRILRPSSLTDQLYIKAARIRSIEEKGEQKILDSIEGEFVGLINYSVLALIQLSLPKDAPLELAYEEVSRLFDFHIQTTKDLMMDKNHDYGEAWRDMRISSFTDMILQKLLRIKQIENNQGKTLVSEGLEANYQDIINYAVFALIKFGEARDQDKL